MCDNEYCRRRERCYSLEPLKLKKGDTIAIIAPASALTESHLENIRINTERLEEMGFKVVYGDHLTGYEDLPFSASIEDRLCDLNWALSSKKIKMIIAARGGYGTMELLPRVDFEGFERHPKIVIGHSDVSALLLPLNKSTNIITYQGPMAGEPWTESTWNCFKKMFVHHKCPGRGIVKYTNEGTITINQGCCEGYLYVVHFDTMMSLFGTKYQLCPKEPYIILVEEIDTSLREIDRMMQTLSLNGILKNASGFVYAKSKTKLFTEEELLDMLRKHLKDYPHIPAFYGLHFGHFFENGEHVFLPNGKYGYIDADKGSIKFRNRRE